MDIIIPFYKQEGLVPEIISSLLGVRDEIRSLGASVVAVNDSPDYAPLAAALESARIAIGDEFPFHIRNNVENLGFVLSCNGAMAESVAAGRDLILLNSDTYVFPGALTALAETAAADPMIAFVSPRSNNATICNLPHDDAFRAEAPAEAFAAFQKLSPLLPPFDYVPTVVGFCLFLKAKVLAEIGLFDPVYSPGYNEENDLIRRGNRFGYCAAIANRGFVWHAHSASFSSDKRAELDRRNAATLDKRYPEYDVLRLRYLNGAAYRAEALLSGLLPDEEGRLDIAFDFSHFGCYFNGTFEAGRGLLAAICRQFGGEFNFHVLARDDVARFHRLPDIPGVKIHPPSTQRLFAVCLRIGQPFLVDDLVRLGQRAPLIIDMMLDTIAMDCGYIEPQRDLLSLWQCAFDHFDGMAFQSNFTEAQFRRRFSIPERCQLAAIPHSLRVSEYRRPAPAPVAAEQPADQGYWFVIGNHYEHKAVIPTVTALRSAFPEQPIVVLGIERDLPEGVTGHAAGQLSQETVDALYRNCGAVIFPSHYEGFGFPLLTALAFEKPIIARKAPATIEMAGYLAGDANLHMFENTGDLIARLKNGSPIWQEGGSESTYGWAESAADLASLCRRVLAAGTDRERIARRLAAIEGLAQSARTQAPLMLKAEDPAIDKLRLWITRNPLIRAFLRPFWRLLVKLAG